MLLLGFQYFFQYSNNTFDHIVCLCLACRWFYNSKFTVHILNAKNILITLNAYRVDRLD